MFLLLGFESSWDSLDVSYFEGPYVVEADGEIVGEGKLLCYNKGDIAHELQRQFDFYCHAYLSN